MTTPTRDTNREVPVKGRPAGYAHLERTKVTERWTLVIQRTQGVKVRIPIGPCACHHHFDCPAGAQEGTARRILRGDHPNLFTPAIEET